MEVISNTRPVFDRPLVRAVGLEPTRRCHRGILSPTGIDKPIDFIDRFSRRGISVRSSVPEIEELPPILPPRCAECQTIGRSAAKRPA